MKNLFIMHTQYNLILAAAVISRYQDAENTLVLYSEFTLTNELRDAISKVFDRVIVVREKFMALAKPLEDVKQIRGYLKKTALIQKEKFDNIYMSQERVFDMILCAKVKKNNPSARCYNIEEDAYYSINNKFNAENFVYKESKKLKLKKFIYSLLLIDYPCNYRESQYCYGMSGEYHGANLLFPHLARRELRNKELVEITNEELSFGINSIYSDNRIDYPNEEKITLFFFDLMNRYKNPDRVKAIVNEIIKKSAENGRKVLLKYHPRETDKFENVEGAFEIPNIIPAEKILLDLKGKDVVVVGNATTSCVVAAKLGFEVISICKIEFPDNKKMHEIMQKMGINCISDISEIKVN